MNYTTKITTLFDEDAQDLMTGEMYPLYSANDKPIMFTDDAKYIIQILFNLKLNRYFDCIQKAKVVAEHFKIKEIHLGSLFVESTEEGVSYGYKYTPPLELHAWVQSYGGILDFALPGTIEKGLQTKDSIGYFLVNRQPMILAGTPPPWVHYQTHEIVPIENIKQLDVETAKELLKNGK
jgi:hypothetical protein